MKIFRLFQLALLSIFFLVFFSPQSAIGQVSFQLKFNTDSNDGSLISHQMPNGDFIISAWSGDWPLILRISENGSMIDTIKTIGFPRYFKFTNMLEYNNKVLLSGVQMDSLTKKDSLIFVYFDTVIDLQNAFKIAIFDSVYGYFDHLHLINNRLMYSGYYILFNNFVESMLAEFDSNFNIVHYNYNLVKAFNDDSIGYSHTTVVQPSNIQYCTSESSFYIVADIKPTSYEAYLVRLNDTLGVDSIYVYPLTFFSQPTQLIIKDSFFLVSSRSVPVGIPARICSFIVFDYLHNKIIDTLIGTSNQPAYPSAFTNLSLVDSHFIFYGYTDNLSPNYYGQSQSSFSLYKMDLLGNVLFKKVIFDSIHYVSLFGVQTTRDGGCLLNGDSYNYYEGNYEKDIFIVKVDSAGNVLWIKTVNKAQKKFLVYPNPTQDKLQIAINQQGEKVEQVIIFDINGREVLNKTFSDYLVDLDVSSLKKGIYMIKVIGNTGGVFNGKFIKE